MDLRRDPRAPRILSGPVRGVSPIRPLGPPPRLRLTFSALRRYAPNVFDLDLTGLKALEENHI
jgi:hypothetical protein